MTRRRTVSLLASLCAMGLLGTACSSDDDDSIDVINVAALPAGTCLTFAEDVGETVEKLKEAPSCEVATHQIFDVVLLPREDAYPGFDALESMAQTMCLDGFEDFVGVSAFDSPDLIYSWLVPTLDSWEKQDDREIICLLAQLDGAPLGGSQQAGG